MHYLHIHTFSVESPDRVSNLKKELRKLPRDPTHPRKSTNISDPTYTSEICALMHQNTDCKTCSTDDLFIQVVGRHRVLVYLASTNSTNVCSNMIPSLVLIQPSPPPRCKQNTQNTPVKVFALGGKFDQLGDNASRLLQELERSRVGNNAILRMMRPFLQRPTTVIPSVVRQQHVIGLTVCIPRCDGSIGELGVCSLGMQCAREALRNVVSLAGVAHGTNGCPRETSILISQNNEYKMTLVLGDSARAFQLHVHRTEDIFSNTKHLSTPLSLCTLSHNFHPMDSVVEEVHHTLVPKCRGRSSGVRGLLAVTQELLRRNVVAATVQSMGTNVGANVYTGMGYREGIDILRAMAFVTDEKSVADALNRGQRKSVVTHVEETVGLMYAGASNDASANVDFWAHHVGALSYAIAHQNPAILGHMGKKHMLTVQEVCMALYSGIAFCHACAYDMEAVEVFPGVRVHVINGTDIRKEGIVEVHRMVRDTATVLSSQTQQTWSDVRHNFRETEDAGADTLVVSIQCHIAESGLIFFQRTNASHVSKPRDGFIGAVYIPPCIVKRPPSAPVSIWPIIAYPESIELQAKDVLHDGTVQDDSRGCEHTVIHAVGHGAMTTDVILSRVKQLAVQTPETIQMLLINATETLFYLNAICIHTDKSVDYHQKLRQAWLCTQRVRAMRLCGDDAQNASFYGVYAHLSNLAALPLDSAGYWANIPYV